MKNEKYEIYQVNCNGKVYKIILWPPIDEEALISIRDCFLNISVCYMRDEQRTKNTDENILIKAGMNMFVSKLFLLWTKKQEIP